MQEVTDHQLLRQYLEEGREEAFATFVNRHVHLVYSAALRKTGSPAAAEEITQTVFIILAKKKRIGFRKTPFFRPGSIKPPG